MGHIQGFFTRDNWAILDKAVTTSGQLDELMMILGKSVLCEENSVSQASNSTLKITELMAKDSIFHEDTLPLLSLRLPKISKWILDTCRFLKTNPYNVKIFLPTTQVYTFDCYGEDFNLLQAVWSNSKYTFKFETDDRAHMSIRQGGKVIEQDCSDITEGTKDNFLARNECKDMKEFAITGDKGSSYFGNPTFEPLL